MSPDFMKAGAHGPGSVQSASLMDSGQNPRARPAPSLWGQGFGPEPLPEKGYDS